MDVVKPEKRSQMMRNIRSRNTKPEVLVRKLLHARGLRFRIGQKIEKTRPDIVMRKHRICIFVHGCFWHQHRNCKIASLPKTNVEFWTKKLSGNKERDFRNYRELVTSGWRVGVIWECATRKKELDADLLVNNILASDSWEIPEPFSKSDSLKALSSEPF